MTRLFKKYVPPVSMLVIATMLLAACGIGPASPTPGASGSTSGTPAAQTTPTEAAGQPTAATGGTANPTMKNADTIVEATIGDPETLDPAWAYDTSSGEAIFNVYETLLFMNKDKTTDFVPMLATKWNISSDGKTYTFNIRPGVKFHDGQALTPEDVAYSFWRGMIQDRAGGPQWIMLQPFFGLDVQSFKDDVVTKQSGGDFAKACQAVQQAVTYDNNAGTVTMHLKDPYGPMLQILTGSWASIVSKPWVTSLGGWNGDCTTAEKFHDPKAEQDELFKQMNGTGPYKFQRWATGEELDFVRNDNYWLTSPLWPGGPSGPAKSQRAVIKEIKEWGTRFSTFQTGDADIAYVDRQYIAQVDPMVKETCDASGNCNQTNANGVFRLYKGLPSAATDDIMFNEKVNTTGGNQRLGSGKLDGQGVPPDFFSDVHIRKAFNYAFDWNTYIKQVWNGEAQQAYGPIPNGVMGYDANQAHYSFDLSKATDEFKASTLKSADGKSVWDTGFTIQYVYNSGNDQRKTAGEVLKDSLSRINPKFVVTLSEEPWPAFLKDTNSGTLPLFMLGWQEDFHDPQDWVSPFLASGGTYSAQQSFPADLQKQLDQLIQQGVSSSDNAARTGIYKQLQNLAYENALDLFVVQPQTRHYEQMWVKGYYCNPIYPGIYFYALSKG